MDLTPSSSARASFSGQGFVTFFETNEESVTTSPQNESKTEDVWSDLWRFRQELSPQGDIKVMAALKKG